MTYNEHLQWLIQMSKHPGFRHHAWHRAQELDKDESGLFSGIADELKNAMLKYNEERKQTGG